MDVWDYFNRREAECAEMSVDCREVEFYEEEGSNGERGRVIGHVYFNEKVYLQVTEHIEIVDETPHRIDYAYFLIVDGVEYWGYERDPSHDPAVHRHTFGHGERHPADPMSFKDVCQMAWTEVSRLDDTEMPPI